VLPCRTSGKRWISTLSTETTEDNSSVQPHHGSHSSSIQLVRTHGDSIQHAMILSYFDDSSDPRHEHYFASGGLMAEESQWKNFHVPWAVATIDLKEPFRSSDCECQQKQFSSWSKEDCNKLMDRLVGVICEQRLHGYASIVPIDEYRSVFPDSGEYDAYYLSVKHTIINMAEIGHGERERYGFGGMKCWFEHSETTSGPTRTIYHQLRSVDTWEQAKSLDSNIYFRDKNLHPLQAADLVAREAFKHFLNQGKRNTRIPLRRMSDLLNFIVWRRPQLEYLRDNGGPDNLELLTSWGRDHRPHPPQFETYWRNY
jgi:hypothetical protein